MADDVIQTKPQQNGEKRLGGCTGAGFMPGVSGNPQGRPKDRKRYADTVRELLASKEVDVRVTDAKGKTQQIKLSAEPDFYTLIALSQLKKAAKGDTQAAEQLIARAEGRPLSSLEVRAELTADVQVKRAPKTMLAGKNDVLYLPDDGVERQVFSRDRAVVDAPEPMGRIVYCDELTGAPTGREDRVRFIVAPRSIEIADKPDQEPS